MVNPIEKQLLVNTGDNAVLMISPIPNVMNPPPNTPAEHNGQGTADEEPLAAIGPGPSRLNNLTT